MVGLHASPDTLGDGLAFLFLSSRRVSLTRASDDTPTLTFMDCSLLSTQSRVDNTDIISC